MNIIQSVVLGIVQGLTEFLPVSSSAHLLFIPKILNWEDIPDSFEVALHFGTLLAILLVFFNDWIKMIKASFTVVKEKIKNKDNMNIDKDTMQKAKIFLYLIVSTIFVALVSYFIDKKRSALKESKYMTYIMAGSLIFMGLALYFVDKYKKNKKSLKDIKFKEAFLVGISQIIALIPGMSRSGTTITTARLFEINKKDAAKYSFLLATPIIFAATVLKVKEFVFTVPFIIGVLVSFITGYLVLKFFMKYLETKDYKVFAVYRVVIGIILILMGIFKFI